MRQCQSVKIHYGSNFFQNLLGSVEPTNSRNPLIKIGNLFQKCCGHKSCIICTLLNNVCVPC